MNELNKNADYICPNASVSMGRKKFVRGIMNILFLGNLLIPMGLNYVSYFPPNVIDYFNRM